jgi:4-amino-4-deoxy-L-arabinose transferase-like glycosyltransferase
VEKKLIYFELLLIVLFSVVVIFHGLEKGNLAHWDEAIYAEISKEILSTQDWITLHYNFRPWFMKPPFFYYLLSITFKFFGISTFTSRLLPALFGVGTILVTFFLTKELFNHRTGFMSSLILITAPQFLHKSRMAMTDVPVTFFIVLTLYLFILAQKRNSRLFYCLMGAALGLGAMTKGAIGLIPFFIMIAYLLLTKNIRSIISKDFLMAFLVFFAITAPWHLIQLILHKSQFINEYLLYHVAKRVAVAIEEHNYGNLFYFRVIGYGLSLWVYPLAASIIYVISFGIKKHKQTILFIPWIVITFGIFLIAKTKLPWYLIPLYPIFAITTAYFLDNINLGKIPIGFVIFILIFIFSFRLPEPIYGNNTLSNINLIAAPKLRVHDSISDYPGELFYLGTKRYSDDELLQEEAFYVADYNTYQAKFNTYKKIYGDSYYILFAKKDIAISKKLSKPPKTQRAPLRYCYTYMPGNLGQSY